MLAAPAGGRTICPVRGSIALRVAARADGGSVRAAGDVQHRRVALRPLIGKEVRHLQELVVLRLLVREADAVVEGQPVAHLPVVLDVELGVVVDHAAFDELLGLLIAREDAERRISVAEPRVQQVVGVVVEVHRALERDAGVLGLEAVVVVEPALERVPAGDLRHADRDVLRPVDVQPAGIALVGRGVADAAAPVEDRRQVDRRAVPERWRRRPPGPRTRSSPEGDAGVRVDQREVGHRCEPVGRVVDQDAVLVAAGQLVADEAVRAFDEGRRVERVVDRESVVRDERIRRQRVGEALDQAWTGQDARRAAPSTCR